MLVLLYRPRRRPSVVAALSPMASFYTIASPQLLGSVLCVTK